MTETTKPNLDNPNLEWFRDLDGDLWRTADADGVWVVLHSDAVAAGADLDSVMQRRTRVEAEHGLEPVPDAEVPEQYRREAAPAAAYHDSGLPVRDDHAPWNPADGSGTVVAGTAARRPGWVLSDAAWAQHTDSVDDLRAMVSRLAGEIGRLRMHIADAPAAPVLPDTVYVVRSLTGAAHPAEGVYLSDAAAEAAGYVIAGDGATVAATVDVVDAVGMLLLRSSGELGASVLAMSLHTDDSPQHGLPVVGTDAVTAALGGPEGGAA